MSSNPSQSVLDPRLWSRLERMGLVWGDKALETMRQDLNRAVKNLDPAERRYLLPDEFYCHLTNAIPQTDKYTLLPKDDYDKTDILKGYWWNDNATMYGEHMNTGSAEARKAWCYSFRHKVLPKLSVFTDTNSDYVAFHVKTNDPRILMYRHSGQQYEADYILCPASRFADVYLYLLANNAQTILVDNSDLKSDYKSGKNFLKILVERFFRGKQDGRGIYLPSNDFLIDKFHKSAFEGRFGTPRHDPRGRQSVHNLIDRMVLDRAHQERSFRDWQDAQQRSFRDWQDAQQRSFSEWLDSQERSFQDWAGSQERSIQTWAGEHNNTMEERMLAIKTLSELASSARKDRACQERCMQTWAGERNNAMALLREMMRNPQQDTPPDVEDDDEGEEIDLEPILTSIP